MNDLHGCTHGWESADGEPSECYDCLRERLTRERDEALAIITQMELYDYAKVEAARYAIVYQAAAGAVRHA